MGLFSRKTPVQPPRNQARTIPTLWPQFFESIHIRLVANGGNDTVGDIAYGVGNAVYNTGMKALTGTPQARDFEALYSDRTPDDVEAADRMIDFLVAWDPRCQSGEQGFVGTLIGRLDDVLSRPA